MGRERLYLAAQQQRFLPVSSGHFQAYPPFQNYGGRAQNYGDWKDTLLKVAQVRYRITELRDRKALTNVYDLYDAYKKVAGNEGSSIAASNPNSALVYPGSNDMAVVAACDASALLKTAYWLSIAGWLMNDVSLQSMAKTRADAGYAAGEQFGAIDQVNQIKNTYETAYGAIKNTLSRLPPGGATSGIQEVLGILKRGTSQGTIQNRVNEAASVEERQLEQIKANDELAAKCENTWRAYIPGWCEAEERLRFAAVAVTGLAVTAAAMHLGKRILNSQNNGSPRSNPHKLTNKRLRLNPVSEAYDPATKSPMPSLAKKQAAFLMKNAFVPKDGV